MGYLSKERFDGVANSLLADLRRPQTVLLVGDWCTKRQERGYREDPDDTGGAIDPVCGELEAAGLIELGDLDRKENWAEQNYTAKLTAVGARYVDSGKRYELPHDGFDL